MMDGSLQVLPRQTAQLNGWMRSPTCTALPVRYDWLMGISLINLRSILRLRRQGVLPQSFGVADVGAQQLGNDVLRSHRIMPALAKAFNVPAREFGSTIQKDKSLPVDAPYANALWQWLGCSYAAIDIEGPPHTVLLDLNFDEVPAAHKGRYHLVTNFGTTEHVADQIQAMKIIHDLTAPGGVMIHDLPMQGYSNHGLINYNPKFFWMLARGSRYHWLDVRVTLEPDVPISADIVGEVERLNPLHADRLRKYRLKDAALMIVLQKREDIPFVAPIDMATASLMENKTMHGRYWSD